MSSQTTYLLIRTKNARQKQMDLLVLFLTTLSELHEWKKTVIRNLGFGSLLEFKCSSNVNDIFGWLLDHFHPASTTFNLGNGFSFMLSPSVVHTILGFPMGQKCVIMKATKEACDIIHDMVQMESPSVEHLCSLLSVENLDELTFSRLFMITALAAFIAPNGRGIASRCYYPAVIEFTSSHNHDWCSFTLDWLIFYMKKQQREQNQGIISEAGGCKFVPVFSYFEFLITSEFNLGASVPRLPLCSTHIVNSYIALDSVQGSPTAFGRLARKHESSTPFKGTGQDLLFKIPLEIQDHFNTKTQMITYIADKQKLQSLTETFFNKLIKNSIPTMKSYIDDMAYVWSTQHPTNDQEEFYQDIDSDQGKMIVQQFIPKVSEKTNLARKMIALSNSIKISEIVALNRSLYSFDSLPNPIDHMSTGSILGQLLQGFRNFCTLPDTDCIIDMPSSDGKFEGIFYPQFDPKTDYLQTESCSVLNDYTIGKIEEYLRQDHQINMFNSNDLLRQKFSLSKMDFLPPGQLAIENEPSLHQSFPFDQRKSNESNMFMYSNQHAKACKSTHASTLKFKVAHTPELDESISNTARGNYWGLSLNERLAGRKTTTADFEEYQHEFPSFKALDFSNTPEDISTSTAAAKNVSHAPCIGSGGKAIEDPILQQAMEQYAREMAVNKDKNNFAHLSNAKSTSNSFITADHVKIQQVLFANLFEQEFYTTLTRNISNMQYSPRIFEINKIWTDQRTLSLSMRAGGWMHPYVMDSFGMLIITDQYWRDREGTNTKSDIIKHIVIKDVTKILMDPMVILSTKDFF